ncbi:MAG: hypothetical protein ACREQB_13220 [Candidatus Binataceae bacterium]
MKRTFEVALASAVLLLVAGCAAMSGGGGSAAGTQSGAAGAGVVAAATGQGNVRDFNLQVKCPGVAYLKKQGWSDEQILAQLNMDANQIPACVQWVESQPKGFVPPPPGGAAPAAGEKAAPAEQKS